jgi:hypothetical protein
LLCAVSCAHAVSVPSQGVAVADHVQPGVVHVDDDEEAPHVPTIVPLHTPVVYVHPWLEHDDPVSWLHGVMVPVHVPELQLHPFVQTGCDRYVLHAFGVPEHVPPMPASPGVHVHPSATHSLW